MKTYVAKETLHYTGTQLSSLWAYKTFSIQGNSLVAFRGACDVSAETMVDLEDIKNQKFIHSDDMVHFIIELFDFNLERGIVLQRLLVSCIKDALNNQQALRQGDDIYIEGKKLNVSIATLSPVSTLIHVGVNVSSKNTPVRTIGLQDLNIKPEDFMHQLVAKFQAEFESMEKARTKVRGVL